MSAPPTLSVIVVTWQRPGSVRACLEHLDRLEPRPHEVVVVDASADSLTAEVVARFAWARHVRFPAGARHMTASRNEGLRHVRGELIAFLDDDTEVHDGWSQALVAAFDAPLVGAVAGRTCNGVAGEADDGADAIGRLLPNGELTGNFAADPGARVGVEHGIGANMAFRRDVLAALGGFRDDFRGVGGVREDADVFMRVRALGWEAVFAPAAVVDHVGAPHVRGRRFDFRYQFWARHNHVLLLARNLGLGSGQLRRWIVGELRRAAPRDRGAARALARRALTAAAVGAGVATSVAKAGWRPRDPVRTDRRARELRAAMTRERG